MLWWFHQKWFEILAAQGLLNGHGFNVPSRQGRGQEPHGLPWTTATPFGWGSMFYDSYRLLVNYYYQLGFIKFDLVVSFAWLHSKKLWLLWESDVSKLVGSWWTRNISLGINSSRHFEVRSTVFSPLLPVMVGQYRGGATRVLSVDTSNMFFDPTKNWKCL